MTDSETAIERLQGLLDERGVEHEDYSYILPSAQEAYEFTNVLDSNGRTRAQFTTCSDPRKVDAYAKLTPEQAIVATLGAEQPPVDKLIRCLENDYGITASWDGLRKVWLTERATLGAGECEMELTDLSSGSAYHDVWLCKACGEQVEQHTVMGKSEPPNYCPRCGARIRKAVKR